MRFANELRRVLSMETGSNTLNDDDITDATIEDEVSAGVDDSEMQEIAHESRQLDELLTLRQTAQIAMESPGDNFKMALMIAASLENYGFQVEADLKDQPAFIEATMESLSKAIAVRMKSLKNRMQNAAGRFTIRRKSVAEFIKKNAELVTAAVSDKPKTFKMTNGVAVNTAIGTQFNDKTVADIEKALQIYGKLIDYAVDQGSTLKSIAALSKSKAAMSATDIAAALKGNLLIENVPEIKTTVFPGNRALTNSKGYLPSFNRPTGNGIKWLGEVSNGNASFRFSRLLKTKTATGEVTISPQTQKKIAELAGRLQSLENAAAAALDFVHEEVSAIFYHHTVVDSQGYYSYDTNNAYMAEGGIIVSYLQTLWNITMGVTDNVKQLSLGLRQVMTN